MYEKPHLNGKNNTYIDNNKKQIDINNKKTNNGNNNTNGHNNPYGHKKEEQDSLNETEIICRKKKEVDCCSEYLEVEFRSNRKVLYCNNKKISALISQLVIVEAENGEDAGIVYTNGPLARNKACRNDISEMPTFNVLRKANNAEQSIFEHNLGEEPLVVKYAQDLSDKLELSIKITSAEWQFDRQKLTVCFTSPQRVDFRDLVKDLARHFRTRIELRQISSREEAKRLGIGVGPCGRDLCCSSFLKSFEHITLEHAKVQQLSNNISKLSGNCVRLKCCLKYEYDMYAEAFEKYPPIHSMIEMEEGTARIIKIDIFKNITTCYIESGRKYIQLSHSELQKYVKNKKVFAPKDSNGESKCNGCDTRPRVTQSIVEKVLLEN